MEQVDTFEERVVPLTDDLSRVKAQWKMKTNDLFISPAPLISSHPRCSGSFSANSLKSVDQDYLFLRPMVSPTNVFDHDQLIKFPAIHV